jgi:hypothetical protein
MHRGAWPFRSISGFFDVLSGIGWENLGRRDNVWLD